MQKCNTWTIPSRGLSNWAVTYSEHGAAQNVLKLTKIAPLDVKNMGKTSVHVRMLAAPINPADINMAEGVYGIKPPLPAFAGNEGVGVVQGCGQNVTQLKIGDWVIPADAATGTWRTEMILGEDDLIRVPSDIGLAQAATITVNPATAYRMLRDFRHLNKGDFVMQNGANSAVGLAVIQIARQMGLRTINIVRSNRPDVEGTLRLLTNLGGDINVPDTFVNSHEFRSILADIPPVSLGLNCVGGDLVAHMARSMGEGATIVTYGGMSKRPVILPFDLVAYKRIQLKGFWVSQWYKTHSRQERITMLEDIASLMRSQQLTSFYEMHDLDDFSHALSAHLEPFKLRKVVLNLHPPDRLQEHDARPETDYEVFETTVV